MSTCAAPTAAEVDAVAAALAAVLSASPLVDYAFGHGSFFAGLPYHDVDVAIHIPRGEDPDHHKLYALEARCARVVGRTVDLHELNGTPPGFRRAATLGRLLWARDPESALQYAELLQRMAWDWNPLQERIIRDLAP